MIFFLEFNSIHIFSNAPAVRSWIAVKSLTIIFRKILIHKCKKRHQRMIDEQFAKKHFHMLKKIAIIRVEKMYTLKK